jgi:hypothetical protein
MRRRLNEVAPPGQLKRSTAFSMYDDDYPTCEETYATLRIYHDRLDPDDVSKRLALTPSNAHKKGDTLESGRALPSGGWFLSSQDKLTSKDVRRHVVLILDQLDGKAHELLTLQAQGYEMDLFCFWASASGHGGPELDHEIMQRLASLRLNIGFDLYC